MWRGSAVLLLAACGGGGDGAADARVSDGAADAARTSGGRMTHGPLLGPVAEDGARIWVRTDQVARVAVEHAGDPGFAEVTAVGPVLTREEGDLTAQIELAGLLAGNPRYYRIRVDDELEAGSWQLETAPAAEGTVRLGFLTDFRRVVTAQALDLVAEIDPDELVLLGDFDHADPGVPADGEFEGCAPGEPGETCAEVLEQMRAVHRTLRDETSDLGDQIERVVIQRDGRQWPVLHVWDDHDYAFNNADRHFAWRDEALRAFREYYVLASRQDAPPDEGLWQRQAYGPVDLFLLDLRSDRDTTDFPAEDFPACGSPTSMLGARQKEWLESELAASTRRWKIVVTTVPFNPTCKGRDGWGGFRCEREELLGFIADRGIAGVVFVSGDIHSGGAIDDGSQSGFPELSIPHANLDCFTDTWTRTDGASCYDPEPDRCGTWSEGLVCGRTAACDPDPAPGSRPLPGLGLVTASPSRLVMEVRGAGGARRKCIAVDGETYTAGPCGTE